MKKKKIIIISEAIKTILEKEPCFLNRSDITTSIVSSNEQALALHQAEKADLIIANIDTPEMSAEKLTSIIRDDKELCKVSIIIVCSDTESDTKRCTQCRANAFVTTPISNSALLQEADHLLNISTRKSLRVPLSIKILLTSKGKPFIGFAENISISGMLLHSEIILFEGDTIICSFYLPDSTHIITKAEVVRVTERITEHDTNAYGIRFIDLGSAMTSAIDTFINKDR